MSGSGRSGAKVLPDDLEKGGEERARQDRAVRWHEGLGIGCHRCDFESRKLCAPDDWEIASFAVVSSDIFYRTQSTKCELRVGQLVCIIDNSTCKDR